MLMYGVLFFLVIRISIVEKMDLCSFAETTTRLHLQPTHGDSCRRAESPQLLHSTSSTRKFALTRTLRQHHGLVYCNMGNKLGSQILAPTELRRRFLHHLVNHILNPNPNPQFPLSCCPGSLLTINPARFPALFDAMRDEILCTQSWILVHAPTTEKAIHLLIASTTATYKLVVMLQNALRCSQPTDVTLKPHFPSLAPCR